MWADLAAYAVVVLALALAHLAMEALWQWLYRVDQRARVRLRHERIERDRYAINHPGEVLPPRTDIAAAMLLAAEGDMSVERAAWLLHQREVTARLKRILDPHPFDRRTRQ